MKDVEKCISHILKNPNLFANEALSLGDIDMLSEQCQTIFLQALKETCK